nr:adenosylcobinamide-phosphate synthase CbiB [Pontibacterium sinense]
MALLLDRLLGEPKRFHPLVGFGRLASAIERVWNTTDAGRAAGRGTGVFAWSLAVIPLVLLAYSVNLWTEQYAVISVILGGVVLYLAIGWQSLIEHGIAVSNPLAAGDLDSARHAVGMIVSRDTSQSDETAIASAATESVLENGADAIFSAIFWFCLLGIPGVVLYRLSNTLDAMWGYKNSRFLSFGWAAARIDDLLNYLPARLTALSYALAGKTRIAVSCWQAQAVTWKSPNAGPVMAAGAGAINVSLGGAAIYHGELQQRPPLGPNRDSGETPSAQGIERACMLVNRALGLWVLVIVILAGVLAWL